LSHFIVPPAGKFPGADRWVFSLFEIVDGEQHQIFLAGNSTSIAARMASRPREQGLKDTAPMPWDAVEKKEASAVLVAPKMGGQVREHIAEDALEFIESHGTGVLNHSIAAEKVLDDRAKSASPRHACRLAPPEAGKRGKPNGR